MARRLVTSLMTSRDYDVIIVTSQSLESSHSETRNRINNPCGSIKFQAHTIVDYCVKNQVIRLRNLGEEAFGVTLLPQVKIANNRLRFYHSSMGSLKTMLELT